MRQIIVLILLLLTSTLRSQTLPEEINNLYDDLTMMPYEEKFDTLNKLMAEDPDNPWYYWLLADIYEIKGENDKVIENFEKAIALDSNFSGAHASLARFLCYADSAQLDKALLHINKAITLEPDNIDFYVDRGNIYLKQRAYDAAIDEARFIMNMSVAYEQLVTQLIVKAMYGQGRMEELKKHFLTYDFTHYLGNMNTEFDTLLGDLYLEFGDKEKACACYQSALEPFTMFEWDVTDELSERLKKCEDN